MSSRLQALREQQLYRRVKNHVTRGQYDGVATAFQAAITPPHRAQFSAGFLSGAFSVIGDSRKRSTNCLIKFLRENAEVAQLVLPVHHQDEQLKSKLTLIFFLSNHDVKTGVRFNLAQNAIKDFTPDLWNNLMGTSDFMTFGYALYQATSHRNDMLETFHNKLTEAQFLDFCNHAKFNFAGRKKLTPDDIAQLIEDRADCLDLNVATYINERLTPAWTQFKEDHHGRADVDMGIAKALKNIEAKKLSAYTITRHYI